MYIIYLIAPINKTSIQLFNFSPLFPAAFAVHNQRQFAIIVLKLNPSSYIIDQYLMWWRILCRAIELEKIVQLYIGLKF